MPYEPFLLGVGVVFNISIPFQKGIFQCTAAECHKKRHRSFTAKSEFKVSPFKCPVSDKSAAKVLVKHVKTTGVCLEVIASLQPLVPLDDQRVALPEFPDGHA